MTHKRKHILVITLLLFVAFFLYDCSSKEEKYHNNMEKVRALSNDQIAYDFDSFDQMEGTALTPVIDAHGDTNFFVPQRIAHIKSFPCSHCHDTPLEKLNLQSSKELQAAHWDIELDHAEANTMNCQTCHAKTDLEKLHSLTYKFIEFDNSHILCGQCHSSQYNDWKGGAHGKREGGWVKPRISKTCVNCHNPHKPSFSKRWPARLNTVKVQEAER